jgi:hypothetical protein
MDGLRHYFYALTTHFGKWKKAEGNKVAWEVLSDHVYGQVIKHQRWKRTVEVVLRVLVGEASQYRERLCQVGLSGRINTSFVERLNLTIRLTIYMLTRRTWGPAHYTPELLEPWIGGWLPTTSFETMIVWRLHWRPQGNEKGNS